MIEITLRLDYDSFDQFWESINGLRVEDIISDYHCIQWSGEEVEEK